MLQPNASSPSYSSEESVSPIENSVEPSVILTTGEYSPLTSQSLPGGGFIQIRIEMILKRAEIPYEIISLPWQRAMNMVETGEAWATFPFDPSAANYSSSIPSDGLYKSAHLYFYHTENKKFEESTSEFKELKDFHDFIFGGAPGYWYGNKQNLDALGVQSEWAADLDGLVRMLYTGRIDFFLDDDLVGWETIQRIYPNNTDQFATLQQPKKERNYGLLTSSVMPGSNELLLRFNKALKELQDENAFESIQP